ncbi:nitronate monooxygenase [Gephyromycinifex aptenodytis]|uniref:nitronate monooxygenase n=1 Tax=Gephyromycinifex aptenodytis TaxID=2716227 RepID=UPI0029CA1390|nr:nitronate monooxygenase [Gephyromycinifex aptenodytis]
MASTNLPTVIQGGMGVAVSSWGLAREVARHGGMGVVSGTALDAVLARDLQDGDPGGHRRRALEHFPSPAMAQRAVERYYRPQGRQGAPYRPNPTLTVSPTQAALELSVLSNFVEVWLAKEGHDGLIGINFLEKIQMATPSAALGAMLGGVDYVLMGAGIPREIPRLLTDLAQGREGGISIDVAGASQHYTSSVDPVALLGDELPALKRPQFLAIISLHSLATYLFRDAEIRPDGFVVEGPVAGGHSAPPRGKMTLDELGQPVYGDRDMADLAKIAAVGLPFWLAGAHSTPEKVAEAVELGAVGVQCGTIFALCAETGLSPQMHQLLMEELRRGDLLVRNDPRASPTGFPFKVASVPGSLSEDTVYEARPRLCDLSYLRAPYEREDGSLGYRCASEPVHMFLKKGGDIADTVGRKCLCNALMANIGLGQERRDGYREMPAITLGQDLEGPRRLLELHPEGWTAAQAVDWLTSSLPAHAAVAAVG